MNPVSAWIGVMLKSGQAMLEMLEESLPQPRAPKVAVIPPKKSKKAKKARKAKPQPKAKPKPRR